MKRTAQIVVSLFFVALLILILLFYSQQHISNHLNGFDRQWFSSGLTHIHDTLLPFAVSRICADGQSLMFTARDPRQLLKTDEALTRFDTFTLRIPLPHSLIPSSEFFITTDGINIITKNTPLIIQAQLDSSRYLMKKLPSPLLTRIAPISATTIAVRGFDSTQQTQLFQTINIPEGQIMAALTIPELTKDAGFSSDGSLLYDSTTNLLLYIQYYQNTFYALDTNMHLVYTAKTIDTTNTNPVYTRSFTDTSEHGGSLMPAVPLKRINKVMCNNNGYLFILSGVQADNELKEAFNTNTVVDMYAIRNGQYQGSFYIPQIKEDKVINIYVTGQTIVAFYKKNRIAAWKMPQWNSSSVTTIANP